jgi:hypothetical protein
MSPQDWRNDVVTAGQTPSFPTESSSWPVPIPDYAPPRRVLLYGGVERRPWTLLFLTRIILAIDLMILITTSCSMPWSLCW